jgi:hypothetical protein
MAAYLFKGYEGRRAPEKKPPQVVDRQSAAFGSDFICGARHFRF